MARRQGGYREPGPTGPGGGGRRYARRGRGDEGVWIALGIAAVAGIIFFFVVSSGSSGEVEKDQARDALAEYMAAAADKDETVALRMLSPKLAVAAHMPETGEKWSELTPAERSAALRVVFDYHSRLMPSLGVAKVSQAKERLTGATARWDPLPELVTFDWYYDDGPWKAEVKQSGTRWLVVRLERND